VLSRRTAGLPAYQFFSSPAARIAPNTSGTYTSVMSAQKIIAREPLLDRKQAILGYEFVVQDRNQGFSDDADIEAVAACAAAGLSDQKGAWLLGEQQVFLEATPALLASEALQGLRPQSTFLSLTMAELAESDTLERVRALREQGFGVSLRDVGSLIQPDVLAAMMVEGRPLLEPVNTLEVNGDVPDIAAQAALLKKSSPANLRLVARHAQNWDKAQACFAAGVPLFAGRLYLSPPPAVQNTALTPIQSTILQLMELVRQEADVRSLEALLKRDAALSFKLLRYINSVGFGLGTEVHSVQHALAMLGYSTLYKWLSLLLATTVNGVCAAALMQTAVVRGRFAELLGAGLLPKSDLENLFVTGMFSLLDKLLGMPMDEILSTIRLPDSVVQALLAGEGIYGPFLRLVCACETREGDAQGLADALFLSAEQVNQSHLAALVWAQALKL
jgi:c-di-GMP-related signal transduction protein